MINFVEGTISEHRMYVLILTDIAVAAAVAIHDPGFAWPEQALAPSEDLATHGKLYDIWLSARSDGALRQRVTAMASAGATSLTHKNGDDLRQAATRFGIPLDAELAARIAEHFHDRREAVLTYRR